MSDQGALTGEESTFGLLGDETQRTAAQQQQQQQQQQLKLGSAAFTLLRVHPANNNDN